MMRADYPNLELLEYMFKQKLMQDEAFKISSGNSRFVMCRDESITSCV